MYLSTPMIMNLFFLRLKNTTDGAMRNLPDSTGTKIKHWFRNRCFPSVFHVKLSNSFVYQRHLSNLQKNIQLIFILCFKRWRCLLFTALPTNGVINSMTNQKLID